jgi:hypothetical protein
MKKNFTSLHLSSIMDTVSLNIYINKVLRKVVTSPVIDEGKVSLKLQKPR